MAQRAGGSTAEKMFLSTKDMQKDAKGGVTIGIAAMRRRHSGRSQKARAPLDIRIADPPPSAGSHHPERRHAAALQIALPLSLCFADAVDGFGGAEEDLAVGEGGRGVGGFAEFVGGDELEILGGFENAA